MPVLTSKVVNPFTRALAPPFIGRRRDFYIPRLPLNQENIPSVNMYMNVFYIPWFAGLLSYIYKPATSSHSKPGLLKRRLWLGFSLNLWSFIHEIHHLLKFPNRGSSRLLNVAGSWSPEFCQFPIIHLLKFPNRGSSRLPNFAGSWSHEFLHFPIILKQTANSWIDAKFGYYFRILLEGQRNV
jgi:hypothetical protein